MFLALTRNSGISETSISLCKGQAEEICELYSKMSAIAGCIAYLDTQYLSRDPDKIMSHGGLKTDVIRCISDAQVTIMTMKTDVRHMESTTFAGIGSQILVPLDVIGVWIEKASNLMKAFVSYCLTALERRCRELTSKVAEVIPNTSAYIGEDMYLKSMVRKHLLQWSGRKDFTESVGKAMQVQNSVKTA